MMQCCASVTCEAELKHGRMCQLAVVGFAAVDLGARVYPTPDAY